MEILRTIFAWFDLPFRELTYENMFERANELKKIDKNAFRYSKFVPQGEAGVYDEKEEMRYTNKMEERISKKRDKATLGGAVAEKAEEANLKKNMGHTDLEG